MIIKEYKSMKPKIDDEAYIAETAEVIGDVEIKKRMQIYGMGLC